jgi:dipeptidyl aminopeptidase/acylaminoacyl peptidase
LSAEKQRITAEDLYKIIYIEDPRISPDGRWIAYVQVSVDKLDNGYKRNIWLVSSEGGKPFQLTRSGKDTQPRWSPDNQWLAFTSARDEKPQVYLLPVCQPGGEARALTSMPNGANNPAWSPDSSHIAFLAGMNTEGRAREDRNEEEPKPQDKLEGKQRKERKDFEENKRWDPRIVERIPYRSGTNFLTDHFSQIYVMSVAEGLPKEQAKPRRLTSVNADHNPPQWTPDGQFILTARMDDPNRDEPWRWSSLFRIRVEDGTHEQLTDETYSSFGPLSSPDGRWIAFGRYPREQLSERITRLAVMPAAGGNIRDLNLELDRNVTEFKWKPDGSGLLFTATSWGDVGVYQVSHETGHHKQIIYGNRHIDAFDVHAGGSIAFSASTPANPNELFWQASRADEAKQMTSLNQSFLDSIWVHETHELRWQSADGVEIQGWYMLPAGYEAGQQYPLALNIHGGPHIMWGPSFKSMWHEWQFHAARGYAVFYCNPRGADGYGEAFQMALHGKWGEVAMVDIMAGVDALIDKGFVDSQRLAITGGSYGGYMTTWITAHSERFVAAVAQRGVYNLLGFIGTTDITSFIPTEFGVEAWDDPMFLWQHSPLAHAHKIKTPTLLIHSENDYRVPISEGEQMFAYIRRSGGTVKLIRFPREGHELTRAGEPEHRVSSLVHMIDWFDRYCYPAHNETAEE